MNLKHVTGVRVVTPPSHGADLGLGAGVLEQVHFTEVVSHSYHPLAVGATQGVDVSAI